MPMQHSGVKPYLRKFAAYYYSRAASSEYRAESGWNIPDKDRRFLLEIGEWLKINGQAIYGAKVWKKSAEGPARIEEGRFTDGTAKKFISEDMRFAVNGGSVYVTCLYIRTVRIDSNLPVVFKVEAD